MSHPGRVVWSEGMFLYPQHFQQQDRWVEGLVRASTHSLRHYGWGFHALELEPGLIAQGKIGIRRAAGVMRDGTAFAIPDDTVCPDAIDIGVTVAQTVIYLVLASTPAGSAEIDPLEAEPTGARYAAREIDVRDNIAHADGAATLHVAEPRFRLLTGAVPRDAYVSMAIARVAGAQTDGTLVLDQEFPVPCLAFGVSPYLTSIVAELVGKLGTIARERAAYITGKRAQGAGDLEDFLVLQLCNRYLAGAQHLSAQRASHPEDLYRWMLELLGEASTFNAGEPLAPSVEAYRHAEPWLGFRPLVAELRRILIRLARVDRPALKIDLIHYPSGACVAELDDLALFTGAAFFLAVKAHASPEEIRQRLPGQTTVGPAEELQSMVNAAVAGIELRHEPTVPREIPIRRNMVYFSFDQASGFWHNLPQSSGLAIHVTGDLRDGLELECWAIRG